MNPFEFMMYGRDCLQTLDEGYPILLRPYIKTYFLSIERVTRGEGGLEFALFIFISIFMIFSFIEL